MMCYQNAVIAARLSLQRALLGEVSEPLRCVVFSIDERNIDVRFYFDGLINNIDLESASRVETEILADYEADDTVSVRCIRSDYPDPIADNGVWVYQRREIFE